MNLTQLLPAALAVGCLAAVPHPADAAHQAHQADETVIVFGADATGSYQLYTVHGDGTGLTRITELRKGDAVHPDWSPDAHQVVFELDIARTGRIAFVDATGEHLRVLPRLAPRRGANAQPSFAPSGDRIYYERYDGGDEAAIFSASLTGHHRRRVTSPPQGYGDTDPNVSPDGSTLSFVRLGPEEFDSALFTVDLATGEETRLTPFSADVAVKQAWAPNGRRLTFSRDGDELKPGVSANVRTMRADGRGWRVVTTYRGGKVNAFVGSYSPDGRWIVYREDHAERAPLMVVRPDGSQAHAILEVKDLRPRFIDWGPAPD